MSTSTHQPDCPCGRHWERTPEYRDAQAERMRGREITWGDKVSAALCGTYRGVPTEGRSINSDGYVFLSGLGDHPLARGGSAPEHRVVLYDTIGPGPHACHWNFGCNRADLDWSSDRCTGLHVDHLDDNKLNNDVSNLVPSCLHCNWSRTQREGRRVKPKLSGPYRTSKTGIRGVSWDNNTGRWRARATNDGIDYTQQFDYIEDAESWVIAKRKELGMEN